MSYYGYCPECGSQLKLIESNDGDFLRCTEYPYCSYVKKWNFEYDELQKDEVSFKTIEKSNNNEEKYYGRCPICRSHLIKINSYAIVCSKVNCNYVELK